MLHLTLAALVLVKLSAINPDPLPAYIESKCRIEFSAKVAHAKALKYAPLIRAKCKKYDLDPMLVASLVWFESNYHEDCQSPTGALGLMQVEYFHFTPAQRPHWRDPDTNMNLGCSILSAYHRRMAMEYRGLPAEAIWQRTLVCYNMGPGGVSRGITRSRYSRAVWGDPLAFHPRPRATSTPACRM